MAIYNRSTLKSRIADFINRVGDFAANALIQKSEDQTIREDVVDSMLTREADSFSINTPAANFTVNFSNGQVCNLNTAASGDSNFDITISNLRANEFGKIVVTKKSNDEFTFANGTLINTKPGGSTTAIFLVFSTGTGYVVFSDEVIPQRKVIEVGAWNMDATQQISVAHGLPDISKIIAASVMVRNDDLSFVQPLVNGSIFGVLADENQGHFQFTDTNVVLSVLAGGLYDTANYSDTGVNRGHILIEYLP